MQFKHNIWQMKLHNKHILITICSPLKTDMVVFGISTQ